VTVNNHGPMLCVCLCVSVWPLDEIYAIGAVVNRLFPEADLGMFIVQYVRLNRAPQKWALGQRFASQIR